MASPSVTFEGVELAALGICLRALNFEAADTPTPSGSAVLDVLGGDIRDWIAFREKLAAIKSGDLAGKPMASRVRIEAVVASPKVVILATAREFDIDPRLFKSPRRQVRSVSDARQMAMFMLREMTNLSLPEIGRELGDRDHSTVLYGVRQIALKCSDSPEWKRRTLRIKQDVEESLGGAEAWMRA